RPDGRRRPLQPARGARSGERDDRALPARDGRRAVTHRCLRAGMPTARTPRPHDLPQPRAIASAVTSPIRRSQAVFLAVTTPMRDSMPTEPAIATLSRLAAPGLGTFRGRTAVDAGVGRDRLCT